MKKIKVRKVAQSLVITITKDIAEVLNIENGTDLYMQVKNDKIILQK